MDEGKDHGLSDISHSRTGVYIHAVGVVSGFANSTFASLSNFLRWDRLLCSTLAGAAGTVSVSFPVSLRVSAPVPLRVPLCARFLEELRLAIVDVRLTDSLHHTFPRRASR